MKPSKSKTAPAVSTFNTQSRPVLKFILRCTSGNVVHVALAVPRPGGIVNLNYLWVRNPSPQDKREFRQWRSMQATKQRAPPRSRRSSCFALDSGFAKGEPGPRAVARLSHLSRKPGPQTPDAGITPLARSLCRLRDLAVEGQPVIGRSDMDFLAVVQRA